MMKKVNQANDEVIFVSKASCFKRMNIRWGQVLEIKGIKSSPCTLRRVL